MAITHVKGIEPLPIDNDNLTTRLWERAGASPDREILRFHHDGAWRSMTWAQLGERVRGAAAGLIASGIKPGDRVALMSDTRIDWTVADLAILAAGGVTVPIYETSSVGQCRWILSDSGAKAAFAGSADNAKNLDAARDEATDLGDIYVLDDGGIDTLSELAEEAHHEAVTGVAAGRSADDLASIIYTSGTTGNPKGCMLTHGNLLSTARQTELSHSDLFGDDESTLLFLPLAHVFARVIQIACLEADVQMGYARSIDTLVEDIQSFSPTFLLAVPRVFEKVFNGAQRKATGAKAKVFSFAVSTSEDWASTSNPGALTNVKRSIADALVYKKLREALGGRVRYCVSGGAPLADHIAYFFSAANIIILEGYGLTETSAATVVNAPDRRKIGTVGQPAPGVEVRIGEDGEILLKGPGIFKGYWQNDKATAEVIDADGWFHTGDIGEIDDDGYLKITGRKKEIIVTAGGKNVAPAVLEERLKSHRLVSQAMVVGDNKPFIAALVTLEPDELTAFAEEHELSGDVAELAESKVVLAEIDKAVAHANDAVSKAEAIRKVVVLDRDFSEEDNELTPTMKLRRRNVEENFAEEIAGIYST